MGIGEGSDQGAGISHLVSRNVQSEFCVGYTIGGGGGQGERISHLVSRYVKAEFSMWL